MSLFVFLVLFILLILIIKLVHDLAKRKYNYWQKKNVPFVKPVAVLGNYANYILLQEYSGQVLQKLCQQFPNKPYFGAFLGTIPILVVQSPELLKLVLTKDFSYFNGREASSYEDKEMLTRSMFFTSGDRWKLLRHNISPLFTTGKLKNMFHLIQKCVYLFEDVLDQDIENSNIIEAKEMIVRYTMDSTCSCIFGIESDTLKNPENNTFKLLGDAIFQVTNLGGFKLVFRSVCPGIFYGLGFKWFPDYTIDFFSKIIKDVTELRNNEPLLKNDFIDLILSFKKKLKETTEIDENLEKFNYLAASQSTGLFAAGFETSATTVSYTLYELAKNQKAQQRAIEEVDELLQRHGNKLNYEGINELPYLEACLYETLRKYPVLGIVSREVMEEYTFPDGLHLDKGVRVHIPVYALHHNADYFPEPEKFMPERFLIENKDNIIPYSFLPYGEGLRIYIGKRLSKLIMLPSLITVLKKYRIELADGMPEILVLDSRTITTTPWNQGLMLKLTKREGWEERTYCKKEDGYSVNVCKT